MEQSTTSKRTTAFGLALAFACLVNSIIVVVKEKSDAVMNGMKKITGHHWTTHSAIVVMLFFGIGVLLALVKGRRGFDMSTSRLIGVLVSSVAVATAIIVGFYLFVD